jgi:predicted AlkP superfamily pyrophosphatase or phosphodiesterase
MLTGVGPARHQILWNVWKPEAGVVKVPTIFSEARKLDLLTAMFVGKEKFRHLDVPGSLDRFDFQPDEIQQVLKPLQQSEPPRKSKTVLAKTVAQNAARYLRQKRPNLCFIHFTDTDDAGHQCGWGSPEQLSAFEDVDEALGIVLNALDESNMTGRTVVIITADHGGHNKTHGLDIPDDMEIPWIAWGNGVKRNFTITKPVVTYDTAVTALWLLDVRRIDSVDGHVVDSAFEVETKSKP